MSCRQQEVQSVELGYVICMQEVTGGGSGEIG
jgi:hypothetical protein